MKSETVSPFGYCHCLQLLDLKVSVKARLSEWADTELSSTVSPCLQYFFMYQAYFYLAQYRKVGNIRTGNIWTTFRPRIVRILLNLCTLSRN